MHKNVFNPITLLAFVILITFSSCSSNKRYANNYKKKTRTERSSRSNSKSTSKRSYSSSSSKRSGIVKTAKKYIGKPYSYGGTTTRGFDCSGFTSHVYKENGVAILGPSYKQAKQGRKKAMKELKEGDLVFFGSGNKVSHVALVTNVSRNKMEVIHSTSSRGVVVDDISNSKYWKKRYLFGRDVL